MSDTCEVRTCDREATHMESPEDGVECRLCNGHHAGDVLVNCVACDGSGVCQSTGEPGDCPPCRGTGWVEKAVGERQWANFQKQHRRKAIEALEALKEHHEAKVAETAAKLNQLKAAQASH